MSFNCLHDRLIADRDPDSPTIIIPAGTCGQASGANDLIRITKRELLNKKLTTKSNFESPAAMDSAKWNPLSSSSLPESSTQR